MSHTNDKPAHGELLLQKTGGWQFVSPANRQLPTANYFVHSPSHLPEYFVVMCCSPTDISIEPV
jgi:hypothetical protein